MNSFARIRFRKSGDSDDIVPWIYNLIVLQLDEADRQLGLHGIYVPAHAFAGDWEDLLRRFQETHDF